MQAMSHEQPVDIPTILEHPRSPFIEVVNNQDIFVPPSSPEQIGHTTVQHVNNSDFVNDPEPAKTPTPPLTDDLNEDDGTSNSGDDSFSTIPW